MLVNPFLVVLHALLPPLGVISLASLPLTLNHQLDRVVNQLRLLQDQLSDIFAALGALTFSQQRFVDAFFAETVATHRGPAAYDKVHADAALDTVDGAHRLDKTVAKLPRVVLFFFLDVVHQLTLFNKFLVPSPW